MLRFDTLNRARLLNAAAAYVAGGGGAVPSVETAGEAEGVFRARVPPGTPTLGASLPDAARDWAHLETLVQLEGTVGADAGAGWGAGTGTGMGGEAARGLRGVVVRESEGADEGLREEGASKQSRRRFVLGWNAACHTPAVLLDATASPRDVIAAALAATHAAAAAVAAAAIAPTTGAAAADGLDPEIAAAAYVYSDQHLNEFEAAMQAVDWRTDFVQMGTAPRYCLAALV